MTSISLKQVTKSFGSVQAVRGIDLEIHPGQIVGILGPNGAGKTTTIRMITGAIPPTAGALRVDGLDSVDDSLALRRRLGYLPESAPLYPEMRVRDFLRYRATLYAVPLRERPGAVDAALGRCHLHDVARRRIGTLSKGYRQRVGLAAAILHSPRILILDEPTNGLDPSQIAETRRLIRDLADEGETGLGRGHERRTTLVVSHILPEVERSCDRIILFAKGRIQADGSPESLIRALPGAGRYTVEAKPQGGEGEQSPEVALRRLTGIESIESSELGDGWTRLLVGWQDRSGDHREEIARACSTAGLLVRELRPQAASLEDVYLRVVAYADPLPGVPEGSHDLHETQGGPWRPHRSAAERGGA